MESLRSYRVFDSQNSRFRKKIETKRIIGSKNKVVFDKSGTFYILTGTGFLRRPGTVLPSRSAALRSGFSQLRWISWVSHPHFSYSLTLWIGF